MAVKHRIVTKDGHQLKTLTPVRAIRQKCLECSAWSNHEVKVCQIKDCALYPFRLGKNPGIKRELTDRQKTEFANRMKKLRATG